MRIIAVTNPKGGVGKTTLAVNLAACLAELGKRVLLVDLDAQACATAALGLAREAGGSLYSALVDSTSPKDVVRSTQLPNLFVIRSHDELAGVEIPLVQRGQHLTRLREVMADLRALGDFDLALLDCPPSMGVMTSAAMAVADGLLVPVQQDFMSLEGLKSVSCLMQQVTVSGVNPGLQVEGVVMTLFDGHTSLAEQVDKDVRGSEHLPAGPLYEIVIPRSLRLAEAPSYGQTIVEYDPQGHGTEAYRALAKEFIDRHRSPRLIRTVIRPNDNIMSETPLSVQVLNLVQQRPGITDSEITSIVGHGVLHQQINQVCHKLKNRGKLTRRKRPDGFIGNYPSDLHFSEEQPKTMPKAPSCGQTITSHFAPHARQPSKKSIQRKLKRNHPATIEFAQKVEKFITDSSASHEIAYFLRLDLKKKTDMAFYGNKITRVKRTHSLKERVKIYAELLLRYNDLSFSKQLFRELNKQQKQTIRCIAPRIGKKMYRWEHVIPSAVIVTEVLTMLETGDLKDIDKLLNLYERAGQLGVTKEEDEQLKLAGLQSSMPSGWNWRSSEADPFARYRKAGLTRFL